MQARRKVRAGCGVAYAHRHKAVDLFGRGIRNVAFVIQHIIVPYDDKMAKDEEPFDVYKDSSLLFLVSPIYFDSGS